MVVSFIGVGSNLDDPVLQTGRAWQSMDELPHTQVTHTSSLYSSAPMGPQDQPGYVNSVVRLHTELPALDLLDALQAIENQQGRQRGNQRWTARTLDLDLLLYDQQVLSCERLVVPHPGITHRSFVLYPLLEICPDCAIPGRGPAAPFLGTAEHFDISRLEERPDYGA